MIFGLPAPNPVSSISRISVWLAGLGPSWLHLPPQKSILTVPVIPPNSPTLTGKGQCRGVKGVCSAADSKRAYSLSWDGQGLDPGLTQEKLLPDREGGGGMGTGGWALWGGALTNQGVPAEGSPDSCPDFLCGFGVGLFRIRKHTQRGLQKGQHCSGLGSSRRLVGQPLEAC